MKKATFAIFFLSLTVISCTSVMPTPVAPVYTPLPPTMTPDPCGPEAIADDVELIRSSLDEFQEVAFIASNTPAEALISPVMRLEEIRQNLNNISVPVCLQDLKQANFNYTAALLMYYSKLMNKKTAREAGDDLQNSEILWKTVEIEYEKVVKEGRLEFNPLTSYESVLIPETGFKAVAFNESDKTVNVRKAPELNAEVVASLEPGVQASIIGRNETGDWTRVYVLGVYGWVFTEMITPNVEIEKLEIVD